MKIPRFKNVERAEVVGRLVAAASDLARIGSHSEVLTLLKKALAVAAKIKP